MMTGAIHHKWPLKNLISWPAGWAVYMHPSTHRLRETVIFGFKSCLGDIRASRRSAASKKGIAGYNCSEKWKGHCYMLLLHEDSSKATHGAVHYHIKWINSVSLGKYIYINRYTRRRKVSACASRELQQRARSNREVSALGSKVGHMTFKRSLASSAEVESGPLFSNALGQNNTRTRTINTRQWRRRRTRSNMSFSLSLCFNYWNPSPGAE